jgi:hypothetical protein
MRKLISWLTILNLLLITQCGTSSDNLLGGSEVGNPPDVLTRNLVGQVATSSSSVALTKYTSINAEVITCAVDTIVAIDSADVSSEIALEEDCTFTLELNFNLPYKVHFLLGGEILAYMYFENAPGLIQNFFYLSNGETDVDLGTITFDFATQQAFPENEPALQNDADNDGVSDYDDDDDDGDGIADSLEEDCDEDGFPDAFDEDTSSCIEETEDTDTDDDGVENTADNCPDTSNADQTDTDGDGEGDACDDIDGDSILDVTDNCITVSNTDQEDENEDGVGDECDMDSDGIEDDDDNCPEDSNADQTDTDGDGEGDECEDDIDGDGILDDGSGSGEVGDSPCMYGSTTDCDDNCLYIENTDQADTDGDGIGNLCE